MVKKRKKEGKKRGKRGKEKKKRRKRKKRRKKNTYDRTTHHILSWGIKKCVNVRMYYLAMA